MPELPEVETIRRDLEHKIIGQRITDVDVRKKKIVRSKINIFRQRLRGNSFTKIERRGKLLIWQLKKHGQYLLLHLKMTGQLIYRGKNEVIAGGHSWPRLGQLPNQYSHVIFSFAGGGQLFFNDLRQFGYLRLVDEKERQKIIARFGIEPLTRDFTWAKFQQAVRGKRLNVKAVLLDQKVIAGIGNIYADEICFRASVKPNRAVNKLLTGELRKIFNSCSVIIRQAIKYRGTTFNDYVDAAGRQGNFAGHLKVYQRAGKKCRRCRRGVIRRIKVAGRGTHYCPRCQR